MSSSGKRGFIWLAHQVEASGRNVFLKALALQGLPLSLLVIAHVFLRDGQVPEHLATAPFLSGPSDALGGPWG